MLPALQQLVDDISRTRPNPVDETVGMQLERGIIARGLQTQVTEYDAIEALEELGLDDDDIFVWLESYASWLAGPGSSVDQP